MVFLVPCNIFYLFYPSQFYVVTKLWKIPHFCGKIIYVPALIVYEEKEDVP